MPTCIVLQTFKGSQNGYDNPTEFLKGSTVELTDRLAEIAIRNRLVKFPEPSEPAGEDTQEGSGEDADSLAGGGSDSTEGAGGEDSQTGGEDTQQGGGEDTQEGGQKSITNAPENKAHTAAPGNKKPKK